MGAGNAGASRGHVLVVEDDPKMAAIIERALRHAAYDTAVATSGDEALWAVFDHDPVAIVLDVMIPHPSGIEVCRYLRGRGWDGAVVVVSARSSPADRDAALRAGADSFLAKPFALADLLSALDRSLTRPAAPGAC
jgi:DNA-binding response OmpR family regulator